LIKGSLQEWHRHHSQNVEGKMKAVKDRISSLDSKAEETVLLEEEEEELHELSVNLYSLARVHSSIYWQKARRSWLKDGDVNTKFFHGIV